MHEDKSQNGVQEKCCGSVVAGMCCTNCSANTLLTVITLCVPMSEIYFGPYKGLTHIWPFMGLTSQPNSLTMVGKGPGTLIRPCLARLKHLRTMSEIISQCKPCVGNLGGV